MCDASILYQLPQGWTKVGNNMTIRDNNGSSKHDSKRSQRQDYWDTVMGVKPSTKSSTKQTASGSSPTAVTGHSVTDNVMMSGHNQPAASSSRSDADSSKKAKSDRKPRPFQCELCQSCYTQKGDMVRHMRYVHEGLRPYQCSYCGNSFGRRSILNKHLKIHTKE